MAIHKSELNTAAVEVEGISKRFGETARPNRLLPWRKAKKPKLALDQVSLHVDSGRITGILGANGSGKSTLIRILATLLTPDAGTASVFGYNVVTQPDELAVLNLEPECKRFGARDANEPPPRTDLGPISSRYGRGKQLDPPVYRWLVSRRIVVSGTGNGCADLAVMETAKAFQEGEMS